MSYYTMAFMGMAPFGSLLAGTMAHAIPSTPCGFVRAAGRRAMDRHSERAGGRAGRGVVLHATAGAARVVRPIYQEMGIIPAAQEMAAEQ
jgi:hypothetical protein